MNQQNIKSWRPSLKGINNNRGWYAIGFTILIVFVAWMVALIYSSPVSPIPKSILSSVNYPVYYPSQNRLPYGYSLDKKSIQLINPQVVILVIKRSSQNMIVVNEQSKPKTSVINNFATNYIPIHTSFWTPIGTATLGAYNNGCIFWDGPSPGQYAVSICSFWR